MGYADPTIGARSTFAAGGTVTPGGAGGNGSKGSGGGGGDIVALTWYVGGNGGNGYAEIEFFNPNGVIVRTEWNTLISALQRQGIQTI